MQINRHNYEEWFLDYHDRNLNEQQVADLLLFLEENPDLKPEFDVQFENIALKAPNVQFGKKLNLKKEESLINEKNLEEFIIAKHEGLLSHVELNTLELFISSSEAHKKADQLYAKVYLQKTNAIRFPNKNRLKRRAAFVIPMYVRMASAAAILLLLTLAYLLKPKVDKVHLANEEKPKTEIDSKILPENMEQNIANEQVENQNMEIEEPEKEILDNKIESTPQENIASNNKKPKSNKPKLSKDELNNLEEQFAANPIKPKAENILKEDEPLVEENKVAIASLATDVADVPSKKNTGKVADNNDAIGIWDYAGMRFKEDVLKEENVSDGKIRENDVAKAVVASVGKIAPKKVAFTDDSEKNKINYGIQIGKFGFSRTTDRN